MAAKPSPARNNQVGAAWYSQLTGGITKGFETIFETKAIRENVDAASASTCPSTSSSSGKYSETAEQPVPVQRRRSQSRPRSPIRNRQPKSSLKHRSKSRHRESNEPRCEKQDRIPMERGRSNAQRSPLRRQRSNTPSKYHAESGPSVKGQQLTRGRSKSKSRSGRWMQPTHSQSVTLSRSQSKKSHQSQPMTLSRSQSKRSIQSQPMTLSRSQSKKSLQSEKKSMQTEKKSLHRSQPMTLTRSQSKKSVQSEKKSKGSQAKKIDAMGKATRAKKSTQLRKEKGRTQAKLKPILFTRSSSRPKKQLQNETQDSHNVKSRSTLPSDMEIKIKRIRSKKVHQLEQDEDSTINSLLLADSSDTTSQHSASQHSTLQNSINSIVAALKPESWHKRVPRLKIPQRLLEPLDEPLFVEEGLEMVPFVAADGSGGLLILNAGDCVISGSTPKTNLSSLPNHQTLQNPKSKKSSRWNVWSAKKPDGTQVKVKGQKPKSKKPVASTSRERPSTAKRSGKIKIGNAKSNRKQKALGEVMDSIRMHAEKLGISGKELLDHVSEASKPIELPPIVNPLGMSSSSLSSLTKRSSIIPKKSVQFHNRINVRGIPHLSQLSEEDIHHRWYRESELTAVNVWNIKSLLGFLSLGTWRC